MITVDTVKAIIGGVAATGSAISSKALSEGLIPDGVEEVTVYLASLVGLFIAILMLLSAFQKQKDRWEEHRQNKINQKNKV